MPAFAGMTDLMDSNKCKTETFPHKRESRKRLTRHRTGLFQKIDIAPVLSLLIVIARLRHNYSRITRDSGDNRPACNSRWAAPIRWSKTARK